LHLQSIGAMLQNLQRSEMSDANSVLDGIIQQVPDTV